MTGVDYNEKQGLKKIERATLQIPGVAAVESWGFQSVRRLRSDDTESDNILLIAPHADTKMLQPTLLEGRWLRPDDTNAIVINTDLLADEPDLILGEEQFQRSGLKVASINTIADLRDIVIFQFNILTSFLLVMAVVLAIVGGLGLTGTMSINVLERVREIGVMRAIGASDYE